MISGLCTQVNSLGASYLLKRKNYNLSITLSLLPLDSPLWLIKIVPLPCEGRGVFIVEDLGRSCTRS